MDDEEDYEETSLYEIYRWTCPFCDDVHDIEQDERGNIIECPSCERKVRLR